MDGTRAAARGRAGGRRGRRRGRGPGAHDGGHTAARGRVVTRLLGLEIAAGEVRVARGERSFGTLRLTALERRPLASPAALPGVLAELARTRADVVLTALPAASATHRFLTLPFRDRGRLARTAPLELLGQLPLDPAGLAVACEPLGPALAAATGARIVPLAEATSLVPRHGMDEIAACAVAAGLVAGAGRAARAGLALGGTEPAGHGSLQRAAALAALALALGALDLGLAHHRLARRDAALVRALASEAAAALPGTRLVAPQAQLEAAVAAATRRAARLGGESGPLEVLRELSARVPPPLRLDLDELAVERDGILLHGRAESFDAVDALRRALAASPLLADVTADETRTTVDGRRVEFRLRAARKPALGASS